MKHGFVRTSYWTKEAEYADGNDVVCILGFSTSDETKKVWDNEFCLNYVIRLGANTLLTQLM